MATPDFAESDGAPSIDYGWMRSLSKAMEETELPATLLDAVQPLERFPEIDMDILTFVVKSKSSEWQEVLHDPQHFNLPQSYRIDFAVCIHVYTLSDPPVFAIINREMFNRDRRQVGGGRSISPALGACLPYIKFLREALRALPQRFKYKGEARRGVKWVYPSPDHHNPTSHFKTGRKLMWYEYKSTSKEPQV
ncbi:hypothetical protein GUITHDRAFT_149871, partial [Guillardia theta CCMP2712]